MAAQNDNITQRVLRRIQQERALQDIAEEYNNSEAYRQAMAEQEAQQYYDNREYRSLMAQSEESDNYSQPDPFEMSIQQQPVSTILPQPSTQRVSAPNNTRMKINPELFNTQQRVSNPLNGLPNFSYERTLPEVRYDSGGPIITKANTFGEGGNENTITELEGKKSEYIPAWRNPSLVINDIAYEHMLPEITIVPDNSSYLASKYLDEFTKNIKDENIKNKSRKLIYSQLEGNITSKGEEDINNKINTNQKIINLYKIYKDAGSPKIKNNTKINSSKKINQLTEKRASYTPITNTIHTNKYASAAFDIIPELAHALQRKKYGLKHFIQLPSDLKIKGKTAYEREGTTEHQAHSIIEPAIINYILTNEFENGGPLLQQANIFGEGSKKDTISQEEVTYEGGILPEIEITPPKSFADRFYDFWNKVKRPINKASWALPHLGPIIQGSTPVINNLEHSYRQRQDDIKHKSSSDFIAVQDEDGNFHMERNPYAESGLEEVYPEFYLFGLGPDALKAGIKAEINTAGKALQKAYPYMKKASTFLKSPYTGKWTTIGNRQYRLSPNTLGMNGVPVESRPIKTVRLYRASGTNGNFEASLDGGKEFAGQWFTDNPTKPQRYASMTVKRAKQAKVDNPIELQYVDIPESELNKYRASEILKGRTDIEYEPTEDFLIPLDYPRQRVPLEGYTGNYLQDVRIPLPELDIKPAIPQITAENATSIMPRQWSAAHNAAFRTAVKSGNRPEALRLIEQAYLRSGIPKTDITITPEGHAIGWYHGSEFGNHTIFDSSVMNATIGGASANGKVKGNFLTTDVPSGMRYAGSNRFSSVDVPEYTSPKTFSEKVKNLFGVYKPRRLYPAEIVGDYAPKPERLFDTKSEPTINHIDKVDKVVYPLYVNPGENVMRLDFRGKPWSQAPVKFTNSYMIERKIHTPEKDWINDYGVPVLEYKTEKIPYKTLEEAMQAFIKDPISKIKPENPLASLQNKKFNSNDLTREIEGYNSTPNFETVKLIETYIPSTTNGAVQMAAKEGYNSVLMKNVIDSNGGPEGAHYAIDDFVTFKPNQQKIADITYDDNGELIDLSERFNWNKNDIRYSLESDFLGKSSGISVPKAMRKADSDIALMNQYHADNVAAYNEATGSNIKSVPFREDFTGRRTVILPDDEFNTKMLEFQTNSPSETVDVRNIGGVYDPKADAVYLRSKGNPSNAYHEFLHSGDYGVTNPEVTKWRIFQLVDENKIAHLTPKQKEYYLSEIETPVHLREQGEHMNINVGDPYPGDEAFDKLIDDYGIGGAAFYMKRSTSEEKRLLWKALNGTLFSLAALSVLNKTSDNTKALGGQIRHTNKYEEGGQLPIDSLVSKSNANFVKRFKDPNRETIPDWVDSSYVATHKMAIGADDEGNYFIFPEVQEINGELIDFTRPPYRYFAGMDSAMERGDTIRVGNTDDALNKAIEWTETYKSKYPSFNEYDKVGNEDDIPAWALPSYEYIPFRHSNKYEEGGDTEDNNNSYLDNIAKSTYNTTEDDNPLSSVIKMKDKGYYNIYPNENKNAITLLDPEYIKRGYRYYYNIKSPILKQGDNYYIPAYESAIKDKFKNNLDDYLDFYGIDKSRFTEIPNSEFRKMLPARGYIGGSRENTWLNVLSRTDWAKEIESVANKYGVDKNLLMNRLMHEGFLDHVAEAYNEAEFIEDQENVFSDYTPNAFGDFGLDYAAKYLRDKQMTLLDDNIEWQSLNEWTGDNIRLLLNENMRKKYGNLFDKEQLYHAEDIENLPKELRDYLVKDKHIGVINEKGKLIDNPSVTDLNAALHMMAADMKRLYDLGIKRGYPKGDMNTYINAMYNMGENHRDLNNASWIKRTYSVPDWYTILQNYNKKQTGGKLSVDGPLFDMLFNNNKKKASLIYQGHKGLSKGI